jgi:hypothetical protein
MRLKSERVLGERGERDKRAAEIWRRMVEPASPVSFKEKMKSRRKVGVTPVTVVTPRNSANRPSRSRSRR